MSQRHEQYQSWVDYYNIRGQRGGDLKVVSGYSHGLAQLTEEGLEDINNMAREFLVPTQNDRWLDLGCGVGLHTQDLTKQVGIVVGLDASRDMMLNATTASYDRVEAMADRLPFQRGIFDGVFCFSILQYFPDLEYAARVVSEIKRVMRPGSRALIMDIPDIAKKPAYLEVKMPDSHNLERLFYSQDWFRSLDPNIQVFERSIRGYGNADFRFSIVLQT